MDFYLSYVKILQTELADRKAVNPRYSLHSFARDIGISAPRLCLILKGKQGLSVESARVICESVRWSDEAKEHFCDLVEAGSSRSSQARTLAHDRIKTRQSESGQFSSIADDQFRMISDWYYFAFLELAKTLNFSTKSDWIAKRLGISVPDVKSMIATLVREGIIDGRRLSRTKKDLLAGSHSPSHAIRKHTMQLTKKAMDAIEEQSMDERYISTLTVAVDEKHLADIMEKLNELRIELDTYIQTKTDTRKTNEVYSLTMHFFRLTKKGK